MPRKGGGSGGFSLRDGVTPRQFCCGCICVLGSVLVLQVCLLTSLLRRLSEVHRSAEVSPKLTQVQTAAAVIASRPIAPAPASTGNVDASLRSQSAVQMPVATPQWDSAVNPSASKLGLAMGAAFGLGADKVLIFLTSLQKASPECDVVLFADKALASADMQAVGINEQRIHFEIIPQAGLPAPWNKYHMSSTRFWLYKNYLERKHIDKVYQYVQLSDIGDVAFQADPFAWVKAQSDGMHVFVDEPGVSIASLQQLLTQLTLCYGDEVDQEFQTQTLLTNGYLIGSARAVEQYVHKVVLELVDHSACQKAGVDVAVHNMILRRNSGLVTHLHENHVGPVWNGEHVRSVGLRVDDSNFVLNQDGQRYVVLHQYDWHEGLWRAITDRLLGARKQQLASLDCSQFEVAPGDIKGFDLSHTPSDTEKDCCIACLGDAGCGAFIFKPSAKHCWLKRPGITQRNLPKAGSDALAGINRKYLGR